MTSLSFQSAVQKNEAKLSSFVQFENEMASYRALTLYNVCSVHRGVFSTSGGVQYIGGCSVHWGIR